MDNAATTVMTKAPEQQAEETDNRSATCRDNAPHVAGKTLRGVAVQAERFPRDNCAPGCDRA
jgi:hypothetical protein